jgi:hypothetical protein
MILFNMASMPSRVRALEESVPRILPQCDELRIYLNNYKSVPEFLKHPKIRTYLSKDHLGDLGDVGKFYTCDEWHQIDGYIFTVDDKILYPYGYVRESIAAIEEYGRQAVISFHGRNIKPNCKSYYFDWAQFFCVYDRVLFDTFVHELGTGCMSFHSSTVPAFDFSIFPTINMTDIWFSIYLQQLKIPILVRRHNKKWITMSNKHDDSYSIHAQCNRRDEYQTRVVNEFQWRINSVEN